MTQTMSGGVEQLRAAMDGTVIVPGDPGFDDARKLWNAEIDRRPVEIGRASCRERV